MQSTDVWVRECGCTHTHTHTHTAAKPELNSLNGSYSFLARSVSLPHSTFTFIAMMSPLIIAMNVKNI
jgi:glucosamine 6-phosphate synthetase-like amidotransferase/phosphosugar isomerase protein